MPTILDVKAFLAQHGIEVWEFDQPTPTSEAAAKAVGCTVAEIAKTILFLVGDQPVVVVTCGDRRIKGSRLKQAVGLKGKVRLPGEDEVVRHTGYAPGGVCPFLLPSSVTVLIDTSMRRFPRVYAAAGNDHSAVPITVDHLLTITGGMEAAVSDAPEDNDKDFRKH
ncbi:YbaK/EbsC family protein [Desulfosoma caldarium]|uniref:Prolyl-tRNA editing enzyme YbaK/EbsC (Cys-tRNA(Pro) deacylase) n=1 Tax=Desulfosoma caldarium TaxID=610254 RepID=A0A3N1UY44_9BACT|nr:YbaK/EbsC family protein [Desulfosoma caldarium]ROQ93610.1 prolyl-tRNA editing enzyme YbaK/EbsC (Cys-tRNA(Pro) deacylase) [Desulfosoma caldarium]